MSSAESGGKIFEFYENSRLDGLLKLEVAIDYINEHYEYRSDRYAYEEAGFLDCLFAEFVSPFQIS